MHASAGKMFGWSRRNSIAVDQSTDTVDVNPYANGCRLVALWPAVDACCHSAPDETIERVANTNAF